jgi:acyl-CoA thioesterase-1
MPTLKVLLQKLLIGLLGASCCLTATAADQLLVLGDSLSAGYGLGAQQSWVSLLQQKLKSQGQAIEVVNASISGDTTAGGLARLPAALKAHKPKWVLIELGANDGLRGLSTSAMQANLVRMVRMTQAAGAIPLLFEMHIPSNYGAAYTQRFNQSFHLAAKESNAKLVPFFLMSIATDASQFLDDGIHPNAAAQTKLLAAIWPSLQPLLAAAPRSKTATTKPRPALND